MMSPWKQPPSQIPSSQTCCISWFLKAARSAYSVTPLGESEADSLSLCLMFYNV